MRASNDFFVVGMAGIGTALFLMQLLIVSRQIVAANNRVQAELAAERSAVPVNWIERHNRMVLTRCCVEPLLPSRLPRPIYRVPPEYPRLALNARLAGFVDLTFTLKPDGSIADAKVDRELPAGYGFAAAAMRVFPHWKFEPLEEGGKAVSITAHYRLSFKLPQ